MERTREGCAVRMVAGFGMKELKELRAELDGVDKEIVRLFEKRMLLCRQVAEYKIAHDMQVLDAGREEQVLDERSALVEDETFRPAVRALYVQLMSLSRAEQQKLVEEAKKQC